MTGLGTYGHAIRFGRDRDPSLCSHDCHDPDPCRDHRSAVWEEHCAAWDHHTVHRTRHRTWELLATRVMEFDRGRPDRDPTSYHPVHA